MASSPSGWWSLRQEKTNFCKRSPYCASPRLLRKTLIEEFHGQKFLPMSPDLVGGSGDETKIALTLFSLTKSRSAMVRGEMCLLKLYTLTLHYTLVRWSPKHYLKTYAITVGSADFHEPRPPYIVSRVSQQIDCVRFRVAPTHAFFFTKALSIFCQSV